jgi:hypothetical protein
MKRATLIATVAVLVAAMAVPAYAAGGPAADGAGNGQGVGLMDQDRDQVRDQDCVTDTVGAADCTADQDRDRVQAQDRDQTRDEDCLAADCTADQERVQTRAQDETGMPGDAPATQARAMVQQRQEQIVNAVRTALVQRFRMMAQWQLSLAAPDSAGTPNAAAIYDGTGFANVQQWWHAWMRQLFNLA